MRISETGITLIKKYEGYHLTAYKCPAGIWTIGYGHTAGVNSTMVITSEKADEFLRSDIMKHEWNVNKYDPTYQWTQNEFDALVSFSFNIGNINQLTDCGKRSKAVIAEKILLYNKAGKRVLAGLKRRREEEQRLFLTNSDIPQMTPPTLRNGSTGVWVTKLQIFLSEKGIYNGNIDGIFGSQTQKAVEIFQQSLNIKSDGIVGRVTWSFID